MEKKLLLIVNPRAGLRKSRAPLYEAIAIYSAAGYLVSVQETKASGDAEKIARERGEDFDLVVCNGGDGTLSETLNGVMQLKRRPPISYLPGGSTNDFAASLGISSNLATAAQKAMSNEPQKIDVGVYAGRYFAYVASFGAFTRTSYTVSQDLKNRFGHLAYFLEGGKDLETLRPYRASITTESESFSGEYLFGAISNSTSIAGTLKLAPELVGRNDGLLEMMLIPVPKTPAEMQALLYDLLRQDYAESRQIIFRHVRQVTAETEEAFSWTLDGEYAPGNEKTEITVIPEGIQLLV